MIATLRERVGVPALIRVVILVHPRDAEGNRVTTAEAQRREAALLVSILERVEQRRQHTRAARSDRMAERNRAAVYVHVVPVPVESRAVGKCLRGECLVRLDEIEVAD